MQLSSDPRNLAALFARFAAFALKQREAGAYDQPMGVIEETEVSKHYSIEQQRNDEKGWHYDYNPGKY